MSTPKAPPAGTPQSPLSEAVEQAGDAARQAIGNLEHFGEQEANALASRHYGLRELATAPVRLYAVLATNAIIAARTASDNLALLSLSGRFGSADTRRAVRVYVGQAAAGSTLQVSDLVGELRGYCIPKARVDIDDTTVAADGIVTVTVNCVGVVNDLYIGTLFVGVGSLNPTSIPVRIAIDEIGIPVT